MKILCDFGEYDDVDYVTFEIKDGLEPLVLPFLVHNLIAKGNFVAKGKKKDIKGYLKSLIKDEKEKDWSDMWENSKYRQEEMDKGLKGITMTGSVYFECEQYSKKDYVKIMESEVKQNRRFNQKLLKVISQL